MVDLLVGGETKLRNSGHVGVGVGVGVGVRRVGWRGDKAISGYFGLSMPFSQPCNQLYNLCQFYTTSSYR